MLDPSLEPRRRMPWWCVRSTAWMSGAAMLAGCVAAGEPAAPAREAMAPPARVEAAPPRLVPVGRDPDGCMMYRVEAPGLTARALGYRTPDGYATFDRSRADCPEARAGRERSTTPAADGRAAP